MKTKTIKRTRPYLCTVCGGGGCPTCEGTGIVYIEELETWDDADMGEAIAMDICVDVVKRPSLDRPEPEPISIFVSRDGLKTEEITFDDVDPGAVTAALVNAKLREKGYDASMVHSMTPLHMLEHAERRATSAEKRCENAQRREREWVDWFEELREKYRGVDRSLGQGSNAHISWHRLEDTHPWPSLEDERAEAIDDE